MERYIQEGDTQAAGQRGEREGYPPGGYGMSLFLSEWQRRWDGGTAVSFCHLGLVLVVVLEKSLLTYENGVEDEKLKLALTVICWRSPHLHWSSVTKLRLSIGFSFLDRYERL